MDPSEGVDRWESNGASLKLESGLMSVNAASRKYQISGSVIDRWQDQARQGGLDGYRRLGEQLRREGIVVNDQKIRRVQRRYQLFPIHWQNFKIATTD